MTDLVVRLNLQKNNELLESSVQEKISEIEGVDIADAFRPTSKNKVLECPGCEKKFHDESSFRDHIGQDNMARKETKI